MQEASALFRLLGDEARLRLLRVLRRALNVTELTGILGIAQSGVSRHLGLLKDAGLVVEERDGGFIYYRLAPALRTRATDRRRCGRCSTRSSPPAAADTGGARRTMARLQEVLRLRKENFETHGGPDTRSSSCPGRSWAAWARALGHLLPPLKVADIGCGEGYLTHRGEPLGVARGRGRPIRRRCSKRAQALAARRHVTQRQWKKGELERLPLRDATVDVALLSQALHHAARSGARASPRPRASSSRAAAC